MDDISTAASAKKSISSTPTKSVTLRVKSIMVIVPKKSSDEKIRQMTYGRLTSVT